MTPASRLNEVITLKHPYFSLIIGAMASEYKDRPSKVLAFKCFAREKFRPYFEKQNGRHSQLFKNYRDALKLGL